MIKKKCLAFLFIGILMFSTILMTLPQTVNATNITPFALFDPNPVSFYGRYNSSAYYFDGTSMGFHATASAADGVSRQLTIEVYVAETNTTHRYTTYTDGLARGVDGISLNGGSAASFTAYCSDSSVKITLDLRMFSA